MNPFKMDFFLWDWFVSNIVLWDGQVSGPLLTFEFPRTQTSYTKNIVVIRLGIPQYFLEVAHILYILHM